MPDQPPVLRHGDPLEIALLELAERRLELSVGVQREDRRFCDLAQACRRRVAARGDNFAHERLARHDARECALVAHEHGANAWV